MIQQNPEEVMCIAGNSESEKHIAVHKAINDLQEVQLHADQLLRRITGAPETQAPPGVEVMKQPQQTLQNILNESPDRIHKICSKTHKILEEITQVLF